MTDVIINHSYIKTPCLQVFLYTNIDNLFKQVAVCIAESNHKNIIYVVVQESEQKAAVQQQVFNIQGYTSFSFVGTLRECLLEIIKTRLDNPLIKIHDQTSLSMAIYDLLIENDSAVSFVQLDDKIRDDLTSVYIAAKQLANELCDLFKIKPDLSDEKVIALRASIKKRYPEILFIDEAFVACSSFYNSMIFAGFYSLPELYIDYLEKSETRLFLIVPSIAFLGDIISSKQRLKALKNNHLMLDPIHEFEEHPLLESFQSHERAFYRILHEKNLIIDEEIETIIANSTLEKIQKELKSGFFQGKINADESITFLEVGSVYEECMAFFQQMQIIQTKDPEVSLKDIIVLADEKIYGPLLSSIGQSLKHPILFSKCDKTDNIWHLITEILTTDYHYQDQNFFIKQVHAIFDLETDEGRKKSWGTLIRFLNKAQFIFPNKNLTGQDYLVELRNACLKTTFFQFYEEVGLFEDIIIENTEENLDATFLSQIDSYIKLLRELNSLKIKNAKPLNIFYELIECIQGSFLKPILQPSFFHKSCKVIESLKDYTSLVNIKILHEMITIYFRSDEAFSKYPTIKIIEEFLPFTKKYRYCFSLGRGSKRNEQALNWDLRKIQQPIMLNNIINISDSILIIRKNTGIGNGLDQTSLIEDNLIKLLACKKSHQQSLSICTFLKNNKKIFLDQGPLQGSSESSMEPIELDAKSYERFFVNTQDFINKDCLGITRTSEVLDLDVIERNLIIWKISRIENSTSLEISNNWLYTKSIKKNKERYLRSTLIKDEESLGNISVKPSLSKDPFILKGVTNSEIDDKFLSSPDKLEVLSQIVEWIKK